VTFDPTPPGADRAVGLMTRLGFYWDWFQLQWSEWVVNYDFFHQDALAQNLRSASRNWSARLRAEIERTRNAATERLRRWQATLAAAPLWAPLSLAAFIGLMLCARNTALRERLALLWGLRIRRGRLPAHATALSYRRMLRLLERRGWTKSPEQTPLEFAAALADAQLAAPVMQLTELYQATRFGGQAADAGKLASLLGEVRKAKRQRPKPL
jgi:hypothetical protein